LFVTARYCILNRIDMKRTLLTLSVVISITAHLVTSCKKESSCEGCNSSNKPPIAVTGQDQLITLPTDSVLLNGTASYDPDGSITAWYWTKISGPASFRINRPDSATTVVSMLVQGIYQFELKVTDDKGAVAKDTLQVTVNILGTTNQPPVACAGQDQTITLPVDSVLLDGSCSTDPDNNITGYQWTKISGPSSFSIANATGVRTQVTSLVEGSFLFQLKVTDAGGLFSMDTVQVIVNSQTTILPADIYMAGQENSVAKYWKNGQQVSLSSSPSTNSLATSITVIGNDVYVAGWEGDYLNYNSNKAKYWKNGQEVSLTGATGSGANSIAVNGNDVYVAGWEINGSGTDAKYWKNGQPVPLTVGSTDAEATCVVVVGGNVYVAGHADGVAKYWKNGLPVSLTNGQNQAYANSIAVVGSDIYVAGSESNGSVAVAKYWKNGLPVTLTNGSDHAFATSIAIAGSDVHVAGYEGGYTNSVAKYWKNGQAVALTNQSSSAYASSIAVYGNAVYVAGYDSGPNFFVAKYWKNGQAIPLTGATGAWATCIFVVPH